MPFKIASKKIFKYDKIFTDFDYINVSMSD